jgi:hypothetical protein
LTSATRKRSRVVGRFDTAAPTQPRSFEIFDAKTFSLVASLHSVCLAARVRLATSHRGRGHVRIPVRETGRRRGVRLRHALPARVLLSASSLNGRKPEPMPFWISVQGPHSLRCPPLNHAGASLRPVQLRYPPHRGRQDSAATTAGRLLEMNRPRFHPEPPHECDVPSRACGCDLGHGFLPSRPCSRYANSTR